MIMAVRRKVKIVSKEKIIPKVRFPSLRTKTKFRSVEEAKKTAKKLELDFNKAKSREEKLAIKRKLILASNRAEKRAKKRDISAEKKKEYNEIAKVYRIAYQQMVLVDIWEITERPAIPE